MRTLLLLFAASLIAQPQTITVTTATRLQTIDGFGASTAFVLTPLTSAQLDYFYTPSGLNFQIFRAGMSPSYAECLLLTTYNVPCVYVASGPTIDSPELANMQGAYARGAKVFISSWSPPASMKSNGVYNAGGAFIGNATNYAAFAAIQAAFVTFITGTYGIPIYAISVQNEPDYSTSYPSCTWTAQQIHDYVPYLHAALAAAGQSATKIMISEESDWGNSYSATAMNDATVAGEVGILAAHAYSGSAAQLSWSNVTTQHVWETEVSDFNACDATITSGITYATQVANWLTTSMVNAWLYWNMTGFTTDNESLSCSSGYAKRAFTIGQFSKFIPAFGTCSRVTTSTSTSLLVVGFTCPNGGPTTLVAVNGTGSAITPTATFDVSPGSQLAVWGTSASLSLQPQGLVALSARAFTYTIPANSVYTFTTQGAQPAALMP